MGGVVVGNEEGEGRKKALKFNEELRSAEPDGASAP